MNTKRKLVVINRIGRKILGSFREEWMEKGSWIENGKLVFGLIGKGSVEEMQWDSVAEAQVFAENMNAEFHNLTNQ